MTAFVMYAMFCWDCGRKWSSSLSASGKPCPFCGSENVQLRGER